jgi:hypothetical protein
VSPATPQGLARALEFDSPAERAAAELRGWLEAGERVVALLAPRGPLRRRALAILAASLEGRFLAARWTGDRPAAPRQSTLDEVRGKTTPTLFLVEDGERLGAEGARVLRALAQDPSAEHCVAVALDAQEAGAVLGGLGPELEIVVLRKEAAGRRFGGPLRIAALGAVLGVAGVSFGVALALLLPRFAPPAEAPGSAPGAVAEVAAPAGPLPAPRPAAPRAATAGPPRAASPPEESTPPAASLPAVAAPPPVAAGPERAKGERLGAAPRTPAGPAAGRTAPPPPSGPAAAPATAPPAAPPTARAAAAAPGFLVVNAIPRAWISLDGAVLGETPIVRHPVAGGAHRVSARFEDGREEERRIEIAGGELYLMFDGRALR